MGRVGPDQPCVRGIIQHHRGGHGGHRVRKCAQLVVTMGVAAVIRELADASFLEVPAYLGLIVAQQRADILTAWEVLGHRVVDVSLFSRAMGE